MRVLIVHPFGIGDVIFSLPLVAALRENFKDGFLGYLCNRRTEELVANLPALDWYRVFEKDEFLAAWRRSKKEGFRQLMNLLGEVRRQRFDLLVDLSLGWHVGLVGIFAGIRERVGFDFRGRGRFLTKKLPISGFHDQPVAGYYLDLLPLCGLKRPSLHAATFELPMKASSQAREHLSQLHLPEGKPLIGLVPGGGASWGPNAIFKQWPPDNFARLADEIAQRRGAKILLIGDARERPLCEEVGRRMKERSAVLLEAPSLLVLAGVLKECALVVGNDSGPMHLAAAVGTKTVSIFGPVDPNVYGPFGEAQQLSCHRVVVKDLSCRPCYREFRFPPCPWDNACLKKLEVSSVLEAVDEALS